MRYERDMRGYGANPPDPKWPGGAHVAVQFVVNYEEGGENCVLHGDKASEAFLSEIVGAAPWLGQRHWNMESIYEYGARAGFWRLLRLFTEADVPITCYGVATALARSPDQVTAMQEAGWEIASHGLKWIDYRDHAAEDERRDMEEAIKLHYEVTGQRPTGWYTGRTSVNTVRLAAQEGGLDYVSDTYDDELPYWFEHEGGAQLIIPYTLDANDMRFATPQGFNSGDQFFAYLKDSFDTLYAEGKAGRPRMMNIGLHCRLVGRPGRVAALKRFVDYVKSHDKVWLARRVDIAKHWQENHPYKPAALRPSRMEFETFVHTFGGVFEHSPWIAERAYELELGPAHDTAGGLHNALCRIFRAATEAERLSVLNAHPDLAGKLAKAKRLTAESTREQASAGLDALTDKERELFSKLNAAYVTTFGFPFIIAVKGKTKDEILAEFETRIGNSRAAEFETACKQVERIALLRLKDMLLHRFELMDTLKMPDRTYYAPHGGHSGQNELLTGRAVFTEAYAVIPKGVMQDIVTSALPFWDKTRVWILSRPLSGFAETFSQYIVEVAPGGGSDRPEPDAGAEGALFVVEGELTVLLAGKKHVMRPGGFAFLPPASGWTVHNESKAAVRFHWIRKAYEAVDGIETPEAFFTNEQEIAPTPMPGTEGRWATTRFVDPADMRHDMHMTIVTLEPGAVIPFAETHVMEHGLYVLEGKAVYRLNQDWVEVEAGDYMWLRAFCPQACYAGGPGKFRYLLYKDVNRHAKLGSAGIAKTRAMTRIVARPLTRENFAEFGDVIDMGGDNHYPINGGRAERYHDLATAQATGPNARVLISMVRGTPYELPLKLTMVERHPFGSQAFIPLSPRPFLVVVCRDGDEGPGEPHAFITAPGQGINYSRNLWHGVLTPLGEAQDFLIVDRGGDGSNLEEFHFSHAYEIHLP